MIQQTKKNRNQSRQSIQIEESKGEQDEAIESSHIEIRGEDIPTDL